MMLSKPSIVLQGRCHKGQKKGLRMPKEREERPESHPYVMPGPVETRNSLRLQRGDTGWDRVEHGLVEKGVSVWGVQMGQKTCR